MVLQEWGYDYLYDELCSKMWCSYIDNPSTIQKKLKTLVKDSDEYKNTLEKLQQALSLQKEVFQLELLTNFKTDEEQM
jgi:hypothetical protein